MGIESTGFLSGSQISADKVDGFDASQTIAAATIPVTDVNGKLAGTIIADGTLGQTQVDATLKRGTALGVAGLTSGGSVEAPGRNLLLTRDGSSDIAVYERTSSEEALKIRRMGTSDFDAWIKETAGLSQIQTASMKGVAGGFPGLVAAPAAANSTGTAGSIAYDASFLYVCVATDTWKRVGIASW